MATMKQWLIDNTIQLITIIAIVIFGYANFTKDIEANANSINELKLRVDKYEDKIDTAIKLLERIDERTSKK